MVKMVNKEVEFCKVYEQMCELVCVSGWFLK